MAVPPTCSDPGASYASHAVAIAFLVAVWVSGVNPEYITISVATLRPGNALAVDLFSHDTATNQIRLYKKADYPLNVEDLDRLQQRGVRRLYITRDAHERYQEYLRLMLSEIDGTASMKTRAGAMNEVVRNVLQDCFRSHDVERTVESVLSLADMVVEVLGDRKFITDDLLQVLYHDYTTFTHSANVAYYAVILAKDLGLPADALRQIAVGALLHDLGKIEVSDAILSKPARLDEFELRCVRQHPLEGFRKLCRHEGLSQGQLMMAYQHHERLDGSGYPVGCVGDEIHPWAKICAVVDAFEALTSVRPYRGPRTPERALNVLEAESGQAYDREIFQCWKETILSCSPA